MAPQPCQAVAEPQRDSKLPTKQAERACAVTPSRSHGSPVPGPCLEVQHTPPEGVL